MGKAKSTLEVIAKLEYEADWKKGMSTMFIASTVAWVSLYLGYALDADNVVFAIFAVVGVILLPTFAYLFYASGLYASQKAGKVKRDREVANQ